MERLIWVCLGSAVGGGLRYLLTAWALRLFGGGFPYGTLAVNLVGSLLIGLILALGDLSATVRVGLTVGLLGGFTTFSAFSFEALRLLQDGAWSAAALYVGTSVLGGIGACFLGWTLARMWAGG